MSNNSSRSEPASRQLIARPALVRSVLLLWLAAVVLSIALRKGAGVWDVGFWAGSLAYAGVLVALVCVRAVGDYLAHLPRPHQLIWLGFFTLLLAGQVTHRPRLTFPFTSWTMYAHPAREDALVVYRCYGIDARGQRVRFDLDDVVPSLQITSVATKIGRLAKASFVRGDAAGQQAHRRHLTELLLAMGGLYNHRDPEPPLRAMELVRASMDLRGRGASQLSEEVLWHVELPLVQGTP